MTETTLEKKFTQEDIDNVAVWVHRAGQLLNGKHEFDVAWVTKVIEGLRPYSSASTVQMEEFALHKLYTRETSRDYVIDRQDLIAKYIK